MLRQRATFRSRVRWWSRRLLPRAWTLRADIRGINRAYRPLIAHAKGEERDDLQERHQAELRSVYDELAELQTRRLLRQAWRYYIVVPERPWKLDDREDDTWEYSGHSDTWSLTLAGIVALQRQIEEAKKRRREAWETWAKILGGLITALTALGSILVSLILAWGR